jgi:RNA polymerase sigma factor (sigma-70 family)
MPQDLTQLSDEELVELIRQDTEMGKQDTEFEQYWHELYHRCYNLLKKLARSACNNHPQDTEDIVNDIYTALVRAIYNYKGQNEATFKAFISGVAKNVIKGWYHRRYRTPMPLADEDTVFENVEDSALRPIDETFIDEIIDVASLIRQNLNPNRFQLIWFMFEELPHEAIAYILGITVQASRARRRQAFLQLQQAEMANDTSPEDFGKAVARLEHLFEKIRHLYQLLGRICGRHNIAHERFYDDLCKAIKACTESVEAELGEELDDNEKLQEVIERVEHTEIRKQHEELNAAAAELRKELDEATERLYNITADELREAIRRVYDESTE